MSTELSNRRSECLLLADLNVYVSYDDLDVVAWAAVVFAFELRVKFVLVIISSSGVWDVHVYYAEVEESALDPQPAHSFIDVNAGAPNEVERSAVPRTEFPTASPFCLLRSYYLGSYYSVADFPLQWFVWPDTNPLLSGGPPQLSFEFFPGTRTLINRP